MNFYKSNFEIIITIRNKAKDFYNFILCHKTYFIVLFLCNIIAYLFSMVSRTVSVDDMAVSYFLSENHAFIAGMRWGLEILDFILPKEYSPFILRFLSFIMMIMASVLLSFIFYLLNENEKRIWPYVLTSCFFSTYPLVIEMYDFFSYLYVPLFLIFVMVSLIYQIVDRNISINKLVIPTILLTVVISGGEDIVCAYITLVLMILFINCLDKKYNWFLDGLKYSIPLFVSLLFRELIGFALIELMGLNYVPVGNYHINWFSVGFVETIKNILINGWYYIVRGLSYLPITEFVILLVYYGAFCVAKSIKTKKVELTILGILIIISLFSLSIVQGEYLHYRNAITIYVFIGFAIYIMLSYIDVGYKQTVLVVLLMCLLTRQSIYTHELLALNNQRSENEAFVAKTIGYKLYSEFDIEKTVIFCGEYQLGDFIESQIVVKEGSVADKIETQFRKILGKEEKRKYQEFVCTNINSYFNKQISAFNGQIMIKKYLSYYGYDINVLENLSDEEEKKLKGYYENIAKDDNMKPLEIKDIGDYILVYLGPTIDGYDNLEY